MDRSFAATTFYAEVTPGSLVIERYRYNGPRGGKGVQWCVHRVEGDGALAQLYVADSRRAAAKCCRFSVVPDDRG